jgi:hypothetical protein
MNSSIVNSLHLLNSLSTKSGEGRNPAIVANLAVAYHYNGLFDLRDQMTEEARRLGYNKMDVLQMLYDGEMTIRD